MRACAATDKPFGSASLIDASPPPSTTAAYNNQSRTPVVNATRGVLGVGGSSWLKNTWAVEGFADGRGAALCSVELKYSMVLEIEDPAVRLSLARKAEKSSKKAQMAPCQFFHFRETFVRF
jgi:hypothetical protein